jgi:hypothetical protein
MQLSARRSYRVAKPYYDPDFAQGAQLDACRTTDCLKEG